MPAITLLNVRFDSSRLMCAAVRINLLREGLLSLFAETKVGKHLFGLGKKR